METRPQDEYITYSAGMLSYASDAWLSGYAIDDDNDDENDVNFVCARACYHSKAIPSCYPAREQRGYFLPNSLLRPIKCDQAIRSLRSRHCEKDIDICNPLL